MKKLSVLIDGHLQQATQDLTQFHVAMQERRKQGQ